MLSVLENNSDRQVRYFTKILYERIFFFKNFKSQSLVACQSFAKAFFTFCGGGRRIRVLPKCLNLIWDKTFLGINKIN